MTSQSSPVPRLEAFAPGAALVTGAAGGIGLALSRALAQAGMAVAMADIDEDSLGARAQELQSHGHRVLALRLDVTDRAAWEQAADRVEEDLGPLHVLCNNAGLSAARSVVIAPGEDVIPADPYPRYVIGSLEPDDFASFELNFRAENRATVPLIISYKDADGDPFEQRTEASLTLNQTAGSAGTGGDLPLGWIALAIVLVAVVGYLIYRSWRR